ncbi:MAG TPA: hypothetical protein VII06_43505 [Chloroflexota bacterium]|jgi:hypothetical protein
MRSIPVRLALVALVTSVLLASGIWRVPSGLAVLGEGANVFQYEDFPAGLGFPTDENVLLGYVSRQDQQAIRAHAWQLWQGITAPSRSVWNGQVLPIFDTWFNATEVFDDAYAGGNPDVPGRRFNRHLEPPRQSGHSPAAPGGHSAAVMSFVKFNRDAARFIWDNYYYRKDTLDALVDFYNRTDAPLYQRQITPFPRTAITLKIVFWLIKRADSPQVEGGLTPLPYWDPADPPPPDGGLPMHTNWTHCVAVDPAGRYPAGATARVNCNGMPKAPRYVDAPVIGLDSFYTYRLSDDSDVASVAEFLKDLSSAGHEQERLVADFGLTPEVGDYLALMAVHMTTKEMDNWTFQTWSWSPTPDDGPRAAGRPASIQGVWRNYVMCTAYDMVTPREPDGSPHVCFNPYLESDLGPQAPYQVGSETYPPDPMAGHRSNCQTCHARAGWPSVSTDPFSANYGRVFNTGYLAPDDPYYAGLVKTDFLWSLIFHSQPPRQ